MVTLILLAIVFICQLGCDWAAKSFTSGPPQAKLTYLREKIDEMEMIPVFEFGEVMGSLIEDRDLIEIEESSEMAQNLRSGERNREGLAALKNDALKECAKAMEAGRPLSRQSAWDFSGSLRDLELDLERIIRGVDFEEEEQQEEKGGEKGIEELQPSEESDAKLRRKRLINKVFGLDFLGAKMKKRMRWVVMQSIVLLLNFVQNEVTRRNTVYMVDKRHAEVPPFPLL